MREYVGVILVDTEGEVLLQLRDDNPSIADPGKLSLFAGALKPGESKEDAMARELYEETRLLADGVQFLFSYAKNPERHGDEGVCHVFEKRGVDKNALQVHEGQGFKAINGPDDINEDNCALISLDILRSYFADR